jgi:hypothetical protein
MGICPILSLSPSRQSQRTDARPCESQTGPNPRLWTSRKRVHFGTIDLTYADAPVHPLPLVSKSSNLRA